MFLGESQHNLDAKGRLCVPKRIQDALDRDEQGNLTCVLSRGFESCLFLFSKTGFEKVLARLDTQPFGEMDLRTVQRLFFASAFQVTLDGNGRLLVPEPLKRLAGIEREVVVAGVYDRAEIWSREAWDAFKGAASADFDRLGSFLTGDVRQKGAG